MHTGYCRPICCSMWFSFYKWFIFRTVCFLLLSDFQLFLHWHPFWTWKLWPPVTSRLSRNLPKNTVSSHCIMQTPSWRSYQPPIHTETKVNDSDGDDDDKGTTLDSSWALRLHCSLGLYYAYTRQLLPTATSSPKLQHSTHCNTTPMCPVCARAENLRNQVQQQ